MSVRWPRVCLVALLGLLLASGAVLVVRSRASRQVERVSHTPLSGEAQWQGDWTLTPRGADPSEAGSLARTDRVSIPFEGTGFDLRVRRGSYRANLWVRIDGEPADQLPQTHRGAFLVLSSPDCGLEQETVTVPIARGLKEGPHVAEIVADRGWGQFPLAGWVVIRGPNTVVYDHVLRALAAGAAFCLASALGLSLGGGRAEWLPGEEAVEGLASMAVPARLVQDATAPIGILHAPAFLLLAAGVFYASPWLPLTILSGAVLTALILFRLDLGLALVALSAPFYLHPRPLLGKSFSMAEILILLCVASWAVRQVRKHRAIPNRRWSLSSPDRAVLLFVLVATVSTFFADCRHVALRELRVAIVEPALFYVMLRTTRLDERQRWRVVGGFVGGAAAVALIGLVQYALDINVIKAEAGFRRLRSVYGSPNNAALYLGRAMGVLLAAAAFAQTRRRRAICGLIALPVGGALLLSFSRASLLLGIPLAVLVLGWVAGGRWRWISLALLLLAAIGVSPLLSTPRFRGLLDRQSGTLFFRLNLWQASWMMFKDHPWLGVGPDNFLYAYRGHYILPSAWQEPHLSHAHNVFLTYATRLGIAGLVAGGWMYVAFWRHSLREAQAAEGDQRALILGLMASVAYGIGHGLVDASAFFPDLAIAFLLALGLVQSARRYPANE